MIIMSLVSFLTTACEQKIDFPIPEGGAVRLVVDGIITNETKAHQVKLSYSSHFNSSVVHKEDNAVVQISDGVNNFLLHAKGNGVYETETTVKGEIGKTYTLKISLPNGDKYEAKSAMSAIGSIDSLWNEITTEEVEDMELKEFYNTYADLTILSEYFLLETDINGNRYGTIKDLGYGSIQYTDGRLKDVLVSLVEKDDSNFLAGSNTITIRMSSTDKSFYEFLIGFTAQLNRGDDGLGGIFDGPAANVQGNINNGAVGYFGAFAVTTKDIIIKQ